MKAAARSATPSGAAAQRDAVLPSASAHGAGPANPVEISEQDAQQLMHWILQRRP